MLGAFSSGFLADKLGRWVGGGWAYGWEDGVFLKLPPHRSIVELPVSTDLFTRLFAQSSLFFRSQFHHYSPNLSSPSATFTASSFPQPLPLQALTPFQSSPLHHFFFHHFTPPPPPPHPPLLPLHFPPFTPPPPPPHYPLEGSRR